MNFKELEIDRSYLINTARKYTTKKDLHQIKIVFKGDKCCLVEWINPNEIETRKSWELYSEYNFEEIIEELKYFDRDEKLNKLLK